LKPSEYAIACELEYFMWLYYYGDFDSTWGALKLGRLPVTSVEQSPHPFLRNSPMADSRHQGVGQDEYQQELKRQYQALPDNLKGMVSFEYFQQQSEQKRDQIEQAILKRKSGPSDSICYDLSKYFQLGYLPLFSSATHYGLWLTRACQHQGICLELDAEHAAFQGQSGQPALLKAVSYGADKPVHSEPENPFPGLFTLPEEMSQEKEWRLVRFLKHFGQAESGAVFSIPRGLIRAIYLGAAVPEAQQQALAEWLKLDMNYKSVPLFRVVIDPYQLLLRREPV
jgi:hypothetical protein